MEAIEFKTWANLKPETPFNQFFPGGRVPICSLLPITPREEGAPLCYLVPGKLLTNDQLTGLAQLLWQQWKHECETLEEMIAYIRNDALPLRTDWFSGVTTIDQGVMMSLVDFGEELKELEVDSDKDWDGNWDDFTEEDDFYE